MRIYNFHPVTKAYLGSQQAGRNPQNYATFLFPANSTTITPPVFDTTTQDCVFTGTSWLVSNKTAFDTSRLVRLNDSAFVPNPFIQGAIESAVCDENITAGYFVNVYSVAGVSHCRIADANNSDKYATGFVLDDYTSGNTAQVYNQGQLNTMAWGASSGIMYYLAPAFPGGITATLPTGAAVIQSVGTGQNLNAIQFASAILSGASVAIVKDEVDGKNYRLGTLNGVVNATEV